MQVASFSTAEQDEILQRLAMAIRQINHDLSELRQYIGADFEVVNLRFDRLEDRIDRLDSNLAYER